MRYKYLLLILFTATFQIAQAQEKPWPQSGNANPNNAPKTKPAIPGTDTDNSPKGNAKLSGVVLDGTNKQPVEFATVVLMQGDKTIDGTTSDEKGKFVLNQIPAGTFKMVISFIGYTQKTIETLTIAEKQRQVEMGEILLEPDVQMLSEIVIEEQKDLIEDRIDRIVYNAEKDITNKGGTAIDVLQKVPMLTVDLDGNVELRGSSNIRVLINNKPSTIMASSVADAIRQIPAETIKSVEVITSPSSKYDSEGTAGIINIITKKNTIQGTSGNFEVTTGNQNAGLSGSVNYRRNKWGLGLNTRGFSYFPRFEGTTDRTNFDPNPSVLHQFSDGRTFGIFGNTQLTFDYDISDKAYISSGLRYGIRRRGNNSDLTSTLSGEDFTSAFNRDIEDVSQSNTIDWNIDFIKQLKKKGQELSILALYSRDFGVNRYELVQDTSGVVNDRQKNNNDNYNQEMTLQVDYVHPVTANFSLETGAKAILREVHSDFRFFRYDFDNELFVNVPEQTDVFDYTQDVYAGYLSLGYQTKFKLGIKAGLRYERTDIQGDFVSTETTFTQSYDNITPSVTISQEIKQGQTLKVSYNRRIQRPSIFFLNPFVNSSDSLNISFGNPNLNPELTDNYEMSYNLFFKKTSFTTSIYWRNTNNAISSIQSVDANGVVSTTYDNVAQNDTYGFSIFGSTQITKKWRFSGNFNYFISSFDSPELNTSNTAGAFSFNLNTTYEIVKGLSVQGFGFYRSPNVQLQGKQGAFNMYSLGVRKELFKGKGGITLGINNLFRKRTRIRSTFETDTFESESIRDLYNQSIRLSFDYKFGKSNNPQNRRKKKINNDDSKQGENDQQGGGGR